MTGPVQGSGRRLGFAAAAAVLWVLLVAVAAPSGSALVPVVGPVAAAIADAGPAVRRPVRDRAAPVAPNAQRPRPCPTAPPLQRSRAEWGLPPPRAPSA